MTGQDFERAIVHAFNDYFEREDVKAIAYRHYQMRFQPQLFDVLVDARPNYYYLAIECKSVDVQSVNGLYFKKHFSWKDGVCQIVREDAWLAKSGRNGFLAVELRNRADKRLRAYFLNWAVVYHSFFGGLHGIDSDVILSAPWIEKKAGKYLIDDEFINDLVTRLDTQPRKIKRKNFKKR